jgi:hypothetical protein
MVPHVVVGVAGFQKSLAAKASIVRFQHVGQFFTDRLPIVFVSRCIAVAMAS